MILVFSKDAERCYLRNVRPGNKVARTTVSTVSLVPSGNGAAGFIWAYLTQSLDELPTGNATRKTVASSSVVNLRSFEAVGCWKVVTWLILPVVICLSQRLSHACLSINKFILWNCEWLIKSVIVYLMVPCYMDNCGNSRANTCNQAPTSGRGVFIR